LVLLPSAGFIPSIGVRFDLTLGWVLGCSALLAAIATVVNADVVRFAVSVMCLRLVHDRIV
jgi:hypothetical protein